MSFVREHSSNSSTSITLSGDDDAIAELEEIVQDEGKLNRRLKVGNRMSIHYLSIAGVAMFAIGDTFDEVSASSTPPPTDGGDGYSASKWANERFPERVNAVFDLPVWIHRPSGIILLASEEHNQNELLLSIFLFSRKIRAVPETHLIQGTMDLVSIESEPQHCQGRILILTGSQRSTLSSIC
ncbi:hypothetical protein UA08_09050 [Talaromyces atroroseus]|uniref:Thioester reductase (TE) domain-containing protein n=1 Tax=Talaromyces atroroseus TaxID=1441469 RepID=A0A1Q5Q782_TALAT|nr:hypothetical protein UA08_09050 [Talaromyces atroroseus]OKL55704.1 hypothetical protein UA08_09050 [Talaromyces atroroseus]